MNSKFSPKHEISSYDENTGSNSIDLEMDCETDYDVESDIPSNANTKYSNEVLPGPSGTEMIYWTMDVQKNMSNNTQDVTRKRNVVNIPVNSLNRYIADSDNSLDINTPGTSFSQNVNHVQKHQTAIGNQQVYKMRNQPEFRGHQIIQGGNGSQSRRANMNNEIIFINSQPGSTIGRKMPEQRPAIAKNQLLSTKNAVQKKSQTICIPKGLKKNVYHGISEVTETQNRSAVHGNHLNIPINGQNTLSTTCYPNKCKVNGRDETVGIRIAQNIFKTLESDTRPLISDDSQTDETRKRQRISNRQETVGLSNFPKRFTTTKNHISFPISGQNIFQNYDFQSICKVNNHPTETATFPNTYTTQENDFDFPKSVQNIPQSIRGNQRPFGSSKPLNTFTGTTNYMNPALASENGCQTIYNKKRDSCSSEIFELSSTHNTSEVPDSHFICEPTINKNIDETMWIQKMDSNFNQNVYEQNGGTMPIFTNNISRIPKMSRSPNTTYDQILSVIGNNVLDPETNNQYLPKSELETTINENRDLFHAISEANAMDIKEETNVEIISISSDSEYSDSDLEEGFDNDGIKCEEIEKFIVEEDDVMNNPLAVELWVLQNQNISNFIDSEDEDDSSSQDKWITIADLDNFRKKKPHGVQTGRSYTCRSCGEGFMVQNNLLEHLKRATMHLSFYCEVCKCQQRFQNICILKNHMFLHSDTLDIHSWIKMKPLGGLHEKTEGKILLLGGEDRLINDMEYAGIWKSKTSPDFETKFCSKNFCLECETHFESLERHLNGNNRPRDDLICRICTFPSPTNCAFLFHIKTHTKELPLVCPDCGLMFTDTDNFDSHLRIDCCYYDKAVSLYCTQCGIIFLSQNEFRKHIKNSHNTVVYRCTWCLQIFENSQTATSHSIAVHEKSFGLNRIHHICHFCKDDLIVKKEYPSHVEKHTQDFQYRVFSYKCYKCGFTTINKLQFKEHKSICRKKVNLNPNKKNRYPKQVVVDDVLNVKQEYIEENPDEEDEYLYQCSLCNYLMDPNFGGIPLHFRTFHRIKDQNYLKNFVIKFKYADTSSHNNENGLETGNSSCKTEPTDNDDEENDTVFSCKRCTFQSVDIESLRSHVITHRKDPTAYQCLECGECFVVRPPLEMHLKYVHDIMETEEYINNNNVCTNLIKPKENQCSVCGIEFGTSEEFQKHFRSHGMAFLNQIRRN